MQYHEYIAADNARREREQQLLNKYDQKPTGQRVQNLWLHQVERSEHYKITGRDILAIIFCAALLTGIFILSIWL